MGQPGADRNLLFGILAVQLDFVPADGLLDAMNAWVLGKDRPLGAYLVERGVLAPDERDLLEALADRHLRRHGGDVQRSLAGLSSLGPLRDRLLAVPDQDIQASLARTADPAGRSAEGSTAPCLPAGPGGRYRVLRPHARGGLGEVYVALDAELHREVALKEMQRPFADSPEGRARFLLEAEVTGRLEHPGIVPVYGLGTYADGRPFYAMRFIRGDSLKEAIERFHAAGGRDPGERALALRQLLGRFVDVCQAVAYAHSRGVLHRDLKPGNIMLGKYGETLVVDWGLAKPLEQGEAGDAAGAGEKPLRPVLSSGSGSAATLPGQALGTPAFMSPEQAAGRTEELGPPSDVYSLGATLYALLTGRAPFQGPGAGAILEAVQKGDFPRPRQVQPAVPSALEAVCLKAMAPRPRDRYPSPRELADEVERWLADEPVRAYPEPATVRLGRFLRRHRTGVAASAALLVTLVAALGTDLVLVEHERANTQRALDAESRRRHQARDALDSLSSRLVEDWLATRQAHELTGEQKQFLEKALVSYEEFAADTGREESVRKSVADAYFRVGTIRNVIGLYAESEAAFRRAAVAYAALAAEFTAAPDYRREQVRVQNNLGNLFHETGRPKESEAAFREALAVAREAVTRFPAEPGFRQELARTHNNLGRLFSETGRPQEAETAYQDALAVLQQLAAAFPGEPGCRDELARSHHNLGVLRRTLGRPQDAEAAFQEALALRKQLAADFPSAPAYRRELARTHNSLGVLLREIGRPRDAAAAYQAALSFQKPLTADFPTVPSYRQELARTHHDLGLLLAATGQRSQAEAAYQNALALQKQLAGDFPDVPRYRQELALTHNNLGVLYRAAGRPRDAEAAYRNALALRKQLAADFPQAPAYRQELAASHSNLGNLLRTLNRLAEAEAAFADALAVQKQLTAEFPTVADYHNGLAGTLVNLALLKRSAGRLAEARRLLEEALPHHQVALKANSRHPDYRQFYHANRETLALTLVGLGDHATAAASVDDLLQAAINPAGDTYNAACILSLCISLAEKDPRLPDVRRRELAGTYADRALALLRDAVANGYRDWAQLAKDDDLAPLRGRAEFQKLLRELEPAATKHPR